MPFNPLHDNHVLRSQGMSTGGGMWGEQPTTFGYGFNQYPSVTITNTASNALSSNAASLMAQALDNSVKRLDNSDGFSLTDTSDTFKIK